jgi:CubicO group peptidase (beta-lactamase class C family)
VFVLVSIVVGINSLNCPDRQFIEESLSKVHIPGATIVVVNGSDILYEEAFGYQSLSPKQSMNVENSIFTLASVSKPFIGVAVMQLVEKKLVDLDTDINQYLFEPHRKIFHPQYPSHSITLRQLLSHTSSIDVNVQPLKNFLQPDDDWFTSQTLADIIFTYVNPNTSNWVPKPPGSVGLYSNEGSSLAALVVERITKISYDQYVKEYIMKPLNGDIHRIGVRLTDFENREELVKHYVYAVNESFLPLWHQELPQFNITQIPVSTSMSLLHDIDLIS